MSTTRRKSSTKRSPRWDRIVADAGPLIALARIGRLALLRGAAREILVPDDVAAECLHDRWRPGAAAIDKAIEDGLLMRTGVGRAPLYNELGAFLGGGEAAAIALAAELKSAALVDDRTARDVAGMLGVPVIGTGGVLVLAKRSGLIPAVGPLLKELHRNGYRMADALVARILKRAGEKP